MLSNRSSPLFWKG